MISLICSASSLKMSFPSFCLWSASNHFRFGAALFKSTFPKKFRKILIYLSLFLTILLMSHYKEPLCGLLSNFSLHHIDCIYWQDLKIFSFDISSIQGNSRLKSKLLCYVSVAIWLPLLLYVEEPKRPSKQNFTIQLSHCYFQKGHLQCKWYDFKQ